MSALCPGGQNDIVAYRKSGISDAQEHTPAGYYLLGDAGHVCSDKLLTPYPGKGLDSELDAYNFFQSQLRIRVEQSFGLLVGRWGILWDSSEAPVSDADCCAAHALQTAQLLS